MIQISITPAQFAKVRDYVAHAPEVKQFTEDSATAGSFRTSQVALSYSYDGAAQLSVTIDQKFGMAKLDSEADIGKRLQAMLAKF